MGWQIKLHDDFQSEFDELPTLVQDELLASLGALNVKGPSLGRPHVDTLVGSKFANMKELRFSTNKGIWRVAFAFDPARKAVILVAGNKAGVSQSRFYKVLIRKADSRFSAYLAELKE
jgi:hypothetical protein